MSAKNFRLLLPALALACMTTFAFADESGHTLAFANRIAHNGTHAETGAFPPSTTVRLCAASEIPYIPPRFYIHTFPGSL